MSNQLVANNKNSHFKLFKVLKQNGHFICGVCRRAHKVEADALTCLKSCGSDDLSAHQIDRLQLVARKPKPKIRLKSKAAPTVFRCKYCKRTYDEKHDAAECAASCKPLFAGKHRDFLAFRHLHLAKDGETSPKQSQLEQSSTKCARCDTQYTSEKDAKACFDSHAIKALSDEIEQGDRNKEEEQILSELESLDSDFDFHDGDSFAETPSPPKSLHKCPVCKEEYDSEEDLAQCYSTHFD